MGLHIQKQKESVFKRFYCFYSIYVFLFLLVFVIFTGFFVDEFIKLKRNILKTGDFLLLNDKLVKSDVNVRRASARCTFYTCFDVYRCLQSDDDFIKVYVYPEYSFLDGNGDTIKLTYSKEFLQIITSIMGSQYYTDNPEEACLFVPFVDTLNFERLNVKLVSQILNSLPEWNNGQNHLIFNMLPGTNSHISKVHRDNSSRALIAGAGLSTWLYRDTHDIAIPFFNHFTLPRIETSRSKRANRRWLLISSQRDHQASHLHTLHMLNKHPTLHDQQHNDQNTDFLFLKACKHRSYFQSCDDQSTVYKYPKVLQQGTFCLVLGGRKGRLDEGLLLECMAAGSIPVILVDPLVLPFSSLIDWARASIVLEERQLSEVLKVLSKVSREKIREMRRQVLFLYDKYFSSIGAITQTTLRIINDRLYPNTAPPYEENNDRRPKLQAPIFLPITVPHTQGFTAVILTYDRLNLLYTLIQQLSSIKSLTKIVIIWNNQLISPPRADLWPGISKPLKVIQTTANKLSNRFYPYKEIETEAVFSLDDDILTLTNDEIEFAFQAWCEYPDRIVGFPSRLHVYDKRSKLWRYESEWVSSLSMVLTAAAFYHKHYNYLYTTSLPEGLLEWVDERMNCEDILFNFMVAHFSHQPPIKVTPRQRFKYTNLTNSNIPAIMGEHMIERSACINYFVKGFKLSRPPLVTVEYRADPLLFKETFPPSEFRRFNGVGTL